MENCQKIKRLGSYPHLSCWPVFWPPLWHGRVVGRRRCSIAVTWRFVVRQAANLPENQGHLCATISAKPARNVNRHSERHLPRDESRVWPGRLYAGRDPLPAECPRTALDRRRRSAQVKGFSASLAVRASRLRLLSATSCARRHRLHVLVERLPSSAARRSGR
jgi:hypothetical protein